MFNAMHLLETALLMLAAFLLGASLGAIARLLLRSGKPAPAIVTVTPSEQPVVSPQVAAPLPMATEVVPLVKPDEAPVIPNTPVQVPLAAGPVMAPARVAGQTTHGVLVETAGRPKLKPAVSTQEAPPPRVVTEAIVSALLASALLDRSEPVATPESADPATPATSMEPQADEEAAARRAIEGNWTPRRRAAPPPAVVDPAPSAAVEPIVESPAPEMSQAVVPLPTVEPPLERPGRPWGIEGPRQGTPDNLTNIIGVLPVIETALNKLGIFHFDQVSGLTDENVAWIEEHLGIEGRVGREHWREQARELSQFVAAQKSAAQ